MIDDAADEGGAAAVREGSAAVRQPVRGGDETSRALGDGLLLRRALRAQQVEEGRRCWRRVLRRPRSQRRSAVRRCEAITI